MSTWTNDDGLYIKFGTTEGESQYARAGEFNRVGGPCVVELHMDLEDLTASETPQSDVLVLPDNCQIFRVDYTVEEAAATGTAIDVGLIKASDRSTEIDYNGLFAALPTASMDAIGDVVEVVVGHTYAGADIGQILTEPALVTASRTDGTAFTAGKLKLEIYYWPNVAVAER